MQCKDFRQKSEETCMRKYGAKTYAGSEQYHLDKLATFIQKQMHTAL